MCSYIPIETCFAITTDYDGIHLDAFFSSARCVGLSTKAMVPTDGVDHPGFSRSELTTI